MLGIVPFKTRSVVWAVCFETIWRYNPNRTVIENMHGASAKRKEVSNWLKGNFVEEKDYKEVKTYRMQRQRSATYKGFFIYFASTTEATMFRLRWC